VKLELDIQRVWQDNFRIYGVRKIWRQLLREEIGVARERLMKKLGMQVFGVAKGVGQSLRPSFLFRNIFDLKAIFSKESKMLQ